jgi:hypothetical protein
MGTTKLRSTSIRDLHNSIDVQDSPPEETAENNASFPRIWNRDRKFKFGKSMRINFVIKIRKNLRTNSLNRGLAVIPNGFENRIRRSELVNLLLSGCLTKVDSISEILDGRETESEIINKRHPQIDEDEGFGI